MSADDLPEGLSEELDALSPGIHSGDLLAAIVTPGDNTVPPDSAWLLETMRTLVEAEGDTIGMVLAATNSQALMVPAPNGPIDPLKMLYVMRKTDTFDSFNWVACAADTYVRITDAIDSSGEPADGVGATEAFKAGMPDAWEALMAICVAPDGPGYDMQQRYQRTPDGIVWEEPEPMSAYGGYVVEMMQEVVLA